MERYKFSKKNWPIEFQPGFIKTLNGMGTMTSALTPIGEKFVEDVKEIEKSVLDIGSAYGVSTYPALLNGAKVIANDLEEEHLNILLSGVPNIYKNKLQTICAKFPGDLDFPKNSLGAIHISLVLHFLNGDQVEEGIRKCSEWLDIKGKLYIVVMTPYNSLFINMIHKYQENEATQAKWPGEISLKNEVLLSWQQRLPKFVHFFMPPVMQRVLEKNNFRITYSTYFGYNKFSKNGKDFYGVIAEKNKDKV